MADIEKFKKKYQASSDEKEDLLAAYTQHKGDMNKIMECVPCSGVEDEGSDFLSFERLWKLNFKFENHEKRTLSNNNQACNQREDN